MRVDSVEFLRAATVGQAAETRVDLPPTGVVLVTGENGAGKSSIAEAVSWALWGETLRGVPLWEDKHAASASVIADRVHATRRIDQKGAKVLTWCRPGADAVEYDTVTKGQAALDLVVGDWDVWRRSHVFSSADAAHFTGASDADRKRLLETVLGLTRLDAASAQCSRALREAETRRDVAARSVAALRERLAGERRRRDDAVAVLASAAPTDDLDALTAELDRLERDIAATAGAMTAATRTRVDAANTRAQAAARLSAARAAERRLAADKCPTCAQPIPEWLRQFLTSDVLRATQAAADADQHARCAEQEDETRRAELTPQWSEQQNARADVGARVRTAEERRRERAAAEKRLADIDEHLDLAEGALGDAVDDVVASEHDVAVLTAADTALGLKGARARLLAGALSGIEAVANQWLGRIAGPGLYLQLSPWTEQAKGGVRDAIRLDVHGAGGGRGYRGASNGERRRVDVALLLALGEVAAAAVGGPPTGTLFVDELFDALDGAGTEAVCDVVAELGRTRCVVVISHSEELVRRLRPDVRMRARNGRVEVL